MLKSASSSNLFIGMSPPSINPICTEIEFSRAHKYKKNKIRQDSLVVIGSPINYQFLWDKYQLTKKIDEFQILQQKVNFNKHLTSRKLAESKTFIDRNAISKKKYWEYLATPRRRVTTPSESNKNNLVKKKSKISSECSPRLLELAKPSRRRILFNWKDYETTLPVPCLTQLENLLWQNINVNPKFAKCYFKTLDRKKYKKQLLLKKLRRKNRNSKQSKGKMWLQKQVNTTVDVIMNLFKNTPTAHLDFKQMLLSQTILIDLVKCNYLKRQPTRGTNNLYSRSLIDIIDQASIWMDVITRYIDVQYTESTTDLLPTPSLSDIESDNEEDENKMKEEYVEIPERQLTVIELDHVVNMEEEYSTVVDMDEEFGEDYIF